MLAGNVSGDHPAEPPGRNDAIAKRDIHEGIPSAEV